MQMVAETEVFHYSETEAPTDTEFTPRPSINTPAMGDIEVTPPVDIEVTSPTSTESSLHINEGFL